LNFSTDNVSVTSSSSSSSLTSSSLTSSSLSSLSPSSLWALQFGLVTLALQNYFRNYELVLHLVGLLERESAHSKTTVGYLSSF
jgi:hypothetical protein